MEYEHYTKFSDNVFWSRSLMEQRNEETKRSCLGMSANKSSILGSVRSSKDFCHQFWRLLRKNSMLHVRGCTTCILSYSIFHFYFVWNFNFWHWWRMLNYSFIFTGRYHDKSNNKTHSRKKHCLHRNTPRAICTGATNVRRRLLIAFFARLFNQSMNQKPSQNGFITRSPLVVIQEYQIVTSSFTHASSDYHESDNLRIDWPVS